MDHASKCDHPPCVCPVGEGEKYCSTHCQDFGKLEEMICACGHRGCTPESPDQ